MPTPSLNLIKSSLRENYSHAENLDFLSALKYVKNGAKVARVAWDYPDCFVCLVEDTLSVKTEDGQFHPWLITRQDFESDDWHTV